MNRAKPSAPAPSHVLPSRFFHLRIFNRPLFFGQHRLISVSPSANIIFRRFSSSILCAMSYIPVPQDSHFSIKNIPFGIFSSSDNSTPRPATAIGEFVLDLSVLAQAGAFNNVSGFDPSTLQQVSYCRSVLI